MDSNAKKTERRQVVFRQRLMLAAGLVLALIAVIALYKRFSPTKERMDAEEYFVSQMNAARSQEYEGVEAESEAEVGIEKLGEDELAIVLEDHVYGQSAKMIDGQLYLPADLVSQSLNSRFYMDEENSVILYTMQDETLEIPFNTDEYVSHGETVTWPCTIVVDNEEGRYIASDFVAEHTAVEYRVEEKTKHVFIRVPRDSVLTAQVRKDTQVRYTGGIKGLVLTEVEKDDTVIVLEELNKWDRVVSPDGFIGYVQKNKLREAAAKEISVDFEEEEYSSLSVEGGVNLVWDLISVSENNNNIKKRIKNVSGVNVICPTWFSISGEDGSITSLASSSYVKTVRKAGMQIWAALTNFEPDVSTYNTLSSTQSRRALISNIMDEAREYELDGINVDLEAISADTAPSYVQFVRELSVECRAEGLILSVDVPVPFVYNAYYNRKELGTVADYVIMMGYDEHYVGSEEAGSVASLPFEENGIKVSLDSVKSEKLVLGIPFYTRLWDTAVDGEGVTWVNSQVLGMNTARGTVEEWGAELTWLEEEAQNYASWTTDEGVLCEIWLEDEESVARKAGLVRDYELGGIASWVLGMQKDEIWPVITENAGTGAGEDA